MRRRGFVVMLGGVMASMPFAARAEQAKKIPTIGFLGAATPAAWSAWRAAFVERLSELGWIEGRTIAIEYRWAEGRTERYPEIAAELVRLSVDVIVTLGTAALVAKRTTHRLGAGAGPDWRRFGREPIAAGRQCCWGVEPVG